MLAVWRRGLGIYALLFEMTRCAKGAVRNKQCRAR